CAAFPRTLGHPLVGEITFVVAIVPQGAHAMSKSVLFAAAVAAAMSAGGSSAYAACDKMDRVAAAWLPIMQTTAYYVAIDEKLFEKACIEIDSNKMESPNQII